MTHKNIVIKIFCLLFILFLAKTAYAKNDYIPREGEKGYGNGPEKIITLPPAREGCYFTTPWSNWVLYEDIKTGEGKSIKVYFRSCFQMGDVQIGWKIENAADFKFGKTVLNTREYPESLDKYYIYSVLANSLAPGKTSPIKTISSDVILLREKRANGDTGFRDTSKVKGIKVKIGPPTVYIKNAEIQPSKAVEKSENFTGISEIKIHKPEYAKDDNMTDQVKIQTMSENQECAAIKSETKPYLKQTQDNNLTSSQNSSIPDEKQKILEEYKKFEEERQKNAAAYMHKTSEKTVAKKYNDYTADENPNLSSNNSAGYKPAAPLVTPELPAERSSVAPANKIKEPERTISRSENDLIIDLGGGITLDMVKIQAAGKSFQMGLSNQSDDLRNQNESPAHSVSFNKDYYISKFEITQGQWKAVMGGDNPSEMESGDNYPVEQISWNDICSKNGFLEKLNTLKPGGYEGFRLPTEAEWEYAARAGSNDRFYWGHDQNFAGAYAWFRNNSENKTHPAGQKLPNSYGLYDSAGNVREWCSDIYASYSETAEIISVNSNQSPFRIIRGGCWADGAGALRVSARSFAHPSSCSGKTGFRLVLSLN